MSKFKFIDLFSGIGGFRVALEEAGGECVAFSEIDKQAIETYKNNFKTSQEKALGDITKCKNFPDADLIVGGVPCQSWSIAGKNRGFDDERGQLWFDSIRSIKQVRPKAFIFENVKGLHDPRNLESLDLILSSFEELNYQVSYKVLNAFDFGLPQNRERIFIVGVRNDLGKKFKFPEIKIQKPRLYEIFEDLKYKEAHLAGKKFTKTELFGSDRAPASRNQFQKDDELNNFFVFCDTRNGHSTIHSWDLIKTTPHEKAICMAFLKNRRKKLYGNRDGNPLSFTHVKNLVKNLKQADLSGLIKKNILRKTADGKYDLVNSKNSSGVNGIYRVFLPESEIFSTLTATGTKDFVATESIPKMSPDKYRQYFIDKIMSKNKYRQITSREAARLQGFPENFKIHANYKYAIKQFGNAVPVNVIDGLIQALVESKIFTSSVKKANRSNRTYEAGL